MWFLEAKRANQDIWQELLLLLSHFIYIYIYLYISGYSKRKVTLGCTVPTQSCSTALDCLRDTSTKISFLTGFWLCKMNSCKIFPVLGIFVCLLCFFNLCTVIADVLEPPKQEKGTAVPAAGKTWANATELEGTWKITQTMLTLQGRITHTHVHYFSQIHPTFPKAFQWQRLNSLLRQSVPWQLSCTSWAERMIIPFSAAAAFQHLRPLCYLPSAISSG